MKKIILLALVLGFSLAAVAEGDRYNDLGVKIQCACGCQQALIKCNHVGCQYSDNMIRQLRAALTNYPNDEDVLNWFRRTYGMTAVTAPSTQGFELTIWVFPLVLAALGVLLLIWISRRWRMRVAPAGALPIDPQLEEFRSRARKETEL